MTVFLARKDVRFKDALLSVLVHGRFNPSPFRIPCRKKQWKTSLSWMRFRMIGQVMTLETSGRSECGYLDWTDTLGGTENFGLMVELLVTLPVPMRVSKAPARNGPCHVTAACHGSEQNLQKNSYNGQSNLICLNVV